MEKASSKKKWRSSQKVCFIAGKRSAPRQGSSTHADPVYARAWEILGILRDAIHPVVTGILREYIADETKTKAEREIAARALAQIEKCE